MIGCDRLRGGAHWRTHNWRTQTLEPIAHDLAIRCAEALAEDERERGEALDDLVAWSLGDEMDREMLLRVDELAWRR